uniref:BZIP domain-containing protein n=1 Tax=Steinernema glaseri TaxID=37863 RepID=A0A1I7YJV9_9BILA
MPPTVSQYDESCGLLDSNQVTIVWSDSQEDDMYRKENGIPSLAVQPTSLPPTQIAKALNTAKHCERSTQTLRRELSTRISKKNRKRLLLEKARKAVEQISAARDGCSTRNLKVSILSMGSLHSTIPVTRRTNRSSGTQRRYDISDETFISIRRQTCHTDKERIAQHTGSDFDDSMDDDARSDIVELLSNLASQYNIPLPQRTTT